MAAQAQQAGRPSRGVTASPAFLLLRLPSPTEPPLVLTDTSGSHPWPHMPSLGDGRLPQGPQWVSELRTAGWTRG